MKPILLSFLLATGSIFASEGTEESGLLRFPATNGEDVVFSYAGDLYIAPLSGGTARRLTSHQGYEIFPRFSPDKSSIAFTGQYDGNTEVYIMPAEGGEPRRLTFTSTNERDDLGDRMGVCLDTCHVWDAGYDIVGDLDGVLEEFDRVIGLDRLHAIHLNDSMNARGSHKDRHARIGEGEIGFKALAAVTNHPKLRDLPFYLETPNPDLAGYAEEIAALRRAHE